jgi:DUF4097 and DUF4098 domain-containing protein YvlB
MRRTLWIVALLGAALVARPAFAFAGDCDGDDDDDGAAGMGGTVGPQKVAVKGPVVVRLEAVGSDMRFVASQRKDVTVNAGTCATNVSEDSGEVEIDVDPSCDDPIDVELPTGSSTELEGVNGNITLKGEYGRVRAETVSGDLTLDKSADVEVSGVSGSLSLGSVSGRAKIETVSGDVKLHMTNAAPQLKFESVSGELDWSGLCAKGCSLKVDAHSSDIRLHLDAKSSFQVKMASHSGSLDDQLGVKATSSGGKGATVWKGTFGAGDGQIKASTYSGDVHLLKK